MISLEHVTSQLKPPQRTWSSSAGTDFNQKDFVPLCSALGKKCRHMASVGTFHQHEQGDVLCPSLVCCAEVCISAVHLSTK